ncbi:hypothetical protein Tco_0258464 [Tanacetum coccineum]
MRPIYSAELKLLGPLALLSKLPISTNHFFNHLSFNCGRWIDLWTPEDCQRVILLIHEDAYDSDVDEAPHAAAAFMANLMQTGPSTGQGTSQTGHQ